MTITNLDASQFVSALFMDRFQDQPYTFTDFTGINAAFEASWLDWGPTPEASQIAFLGFAYQNNQINEHTGRFTPRDYLKSVNV